MQKHTEYYQNKKLQFKRKKREKNDQLFYMKF